ncbi:MAG TPA: response regulator transcription factor [Chloroflexota bacterium]|nr:response regulator transcription factor [Chloroflexota bacterium]
MTFPAPGRERRAGDLNHQGGEDSSGPPIRLVVIDDHPVVREGLVALLEDEAGFQVVAAAGSAEQALRLVEQQQPDVLLLDLELPGIDGVTAIPKLSAIAPALRIIVFSAYGGGERLLGAIKAGARGYLLKGASGEELARAIRTVHGGGTALESGLAETLMAAVRGPRPGGPALSRREQEVLHLLAQGLANKQIARALTISERTVKFHVTSIFNKLGADNRAQAVALAAQRHLL